MADLGSTLWTEVDSTNNATPPDGWPEGMAPSNVNNSARAEMGGEKRFWVRSNSVFTTAGTTTAYTLTYGQAATAYYDGEEFSFVVNATCGAAPTLNINALGARQIRKFTGGAYANIAAGDIVANQQLRVRYNLAATTFDILSSSAGAITGAGATTFLAADVALNNTANFFNGPNTGSIGANGQKWLIMAVASVVDTAGNGTFEAAIHDGTNYLVDSTTTTAAANLRGQLSVQIVVTLSAATTFTLRAKDSTSTSGFLGTTSGATGVANTATSITAVRLS